MMKFYLRRFLASIAGVLFIFPVFSQTTVPPFVSDSLDSYVERALQRWQIPGVAICVVKDGEVVVAKGYGVREAGKPEKVDENTLFMIASNTKAFTGTALSMLQFEGKCSLDDRVRKFLPDFTMKDPWVTEHLNLRDVMSHRIGMETFQGDFMYWESDLSSEEVIEKFGQLTPVYDYRTTWGYCNAGYVIAGACLEKMAGQTWDSFISKRIIKPLKMDRTLVLTSGIKTAENIAVPYTLVNDQLVRLDHCQIDNLAPAASISSSAVDMSHWLIALLDSGRFEGRQVIPYSAIRTAMYPTSIEGRGGHPFNNSHFKLYGLGWDLQDYENREIVSHNGGVDGFVTSVTLVPEENLGIVVLTNTDANNLYIALKWEIIDAYLGLPFRNYSDFIFDRYHMMVKKENEYLAKLRDTAALKLPSPVKLKEYEGKYEHEIYGYTEIKADKDHLLMTFQHHPDLQAKLEYLGGDRFLCTYSNPLFGVKVFPFTLKDGKVESFVLSVADFLEFTTYTFRKL